MESMTSRSHINLFISDLLDFYSSPVGSTLLLFFIGFIILFVYYLKGLPKRFHDEALSVFRHNLDLLKILRSEAEPKKVEAYIDFANMYRDLLADPTTFLQEIQADKNKQIELRRRNIELGTKLYFFASDDTILKYLSFREKSMSKDSFQQNIPVELDFYAKTIASMRKDIWGKETTLTEAAFLKTFL